MYISCVYRVAICGGVCKPVQVGLYVSVSDHLYPSMSVSLHQCIYYYMQILQIYAYEGIVHWLIRPKVKSVCKYISHHIKA